MKNPVAAAIIAARNPIELQQVLWHARHVHWRYVAVNTQNQWQNRANACAEYFMDTTPADAFWVYNTVFTFLRPEQCDLLLERAKRRYSTHIRCTNQNSTGSSSSSMNSSKSKVQPTHLHSSP